MTSPSLVRAMTASLKQTEHEIIDGTAVALAKRYADVIQSAAAISAELESLRPEDEAQAAVIVRLKAAFDAQNVLSDLGPKLLAALAALNMTPSARSAKGGVLVAASPAGTALAELRARRTVAR